MVQFDLLSPPPRQPPGQLQPFGLEGGELFEAVLSRGKGVGHKKYLVLFDFTKNMSFLGWFARWLRTSRLRIFKDKLGYLSESG